MIHKILVLTDFSENSKLAFQWACAIAGKLNASIHVFNRIEPPEDWEKTIGGESEDRLREYVLLVEQKLKDFVQTPFSDEIEMTTSFESGNFTEQVTALQKLHAFDLVVMGAQGQSEEEKGAMGSHTIKAVRKLPANMLIVPAGSTPPERIGKVLFASSLDQSDRSVLKWLIQLLQLFATSEMHILSVNTQSYFSQPTIVMREALNDFAELGHQLDPKIRIQTHFYKNDSVLGGINSFSAEEEVDLIAVSNREKHPIRRILLGSTVEALVKGSDAPVLCIHLS